MKHIANHPESIATTLKLADRVKNSVMDSVWEVRMQYDLQALILTVKFSLCEGARSWVSIGGRRAGRGSLEEASTQPAPGCCESRAGGIPQDGKPGQPSVTKAPVEALYNYSGIVDSWRRVANQNTYVRDQPDPAAMRGGGKPRPRLSLWLRSKSV